MSIDTLCEWGGLATQQTNAANTAAALSRKGINIKHMCVYGLGRLILTLPVEVIKVHLEQVGQCKVA